MPTPVTVPLQRVTQAERITQRLGITRTTMDRAHRLWHERHPDQPGDVPWQVLCGRSGKLTPAQRRQVCKLALAGRREYEIVKGLGFGEGLVHGVLNALRCELGR